jgi:hypothetical protein
MVKRIALLVVAFACVIGLGYPATLAGHSHDRDDNDTLQITIRDFCDKNTFPAGLCTGNGKITFAAFNADLARSKTPARGNSRPMSPRRKRAST